MAEALRGLAEALRGLSEALRGLAEALRGLAWGGGRIYGWTEFLPILQDFVPYRGRCPKIR